LALEPAWVFQPFPERAQAAEDKTEKARVENWAPFCDPV